MRYDDILQVDYPFALKHERMPRNERAAQFMPFAALTGHSEVIREAGLELDDKPVISNDKKEELDLLINFILGNGLVAKYTFFEKNRADKGYLKEYLGIVKRYDLKEKSLIFRDKKKILVADILDISIIENN